MTDFYGVGSNRVRCRSRHARVPEVAAMKTATQSEQEVRAEDIRQVARARLLYMKKERGWSQMQLAESMGVSASLITQIKKGDQDMTMDTVMRACRAFEMSPAEFLFGGGSPLSDALARLPSDARTAIEAIIAAVDSASAR